MFDQALYESIKMILCKIEVAKKREDIHELLLSNGVDSTTLSEDEMNFEIASCILTEDEIGVYYRYLKYKEKEDKNRFLNSITFLEESVTNINELYNKKDGITKKINNIKSKCNELNIGLREFPRIKLSTKYHIAKAAYDKYLSTFVRVGMKEYDLKDGIKKIKSKNIVIRRLNKSKLGKLKSELKHLDGVDVKSVNLLLETFKKEKNAYIDFIKEIIRDYLKNRSFTQPLILSALTYGNNREDIKIDKNGVPYVGSEVVENFDEEYLFTQFFNFYEADGNEDISVSVVEEKFVEFVLMTYNLEIKKLERQKNKCVNDIRDEHRKQQELIENINNPTKYMSIDETLVTEDEKDTFSLLYTCSRK